MKDVLWIEDIVESTQAPPFLTNLKIDIASFVNPHKVVVRRNVFLTFSNAQNESESKGGIESKKSIFTSEMEFEFSNDV
jgi:hypothetical protein